jgi:hypothetical protein
MPSVTTVTPSRLNYTYCTVRSLEVRKMRLHFRAKLRTAPRKNEIVCITDKRTGLKWREGRCRSVSLQRTFEHESLDTGALKIVKRPFNEA